jgi:uncharacterized membrane protein SpoIIM required for sporulation/ABC-type transport system involved in multi-copper enzyme maturation permease subunit
MLTQFPLLDYHNWRMALIIASREIRDTMRDWRMVSPILGLTLFFPALMTFVAREMTDFLVAYNSELISERAIPLLLMVVGFFPTSFSLVIALESFAGEKERRSLEPLLSTPLSDAQLYMGKMIASLVPPVLASYVGITIYSLSVTFLVAPMRPQSMILIVVLTTVQAALMVAAAVVVSTQATSVRAANLLASFIIVPVALLLQLEAFLMAFEDYFTLWLIVLAVTIITLIFARMGVLLFNREWLLGRNIDFINLIWVRDFVWQRLSGQTTAGVYPGWWAWYSGTWRLVGTLRLAVGALLVGFLLALGMGIVIAYQYPLPPDTLSNLRTEVGTEKLTAVQTLLNQLPFYIFTHNIRAILVTVVLGTLSFGVATVLIFMLPWIVIAFSAMQFSFIGENGLLFVSAAVLPHAIFEFPAMLLTIAAALRWQVVFISPPHNRTISENWLEAGADFLRILLAIGIPLFFIAAFVEAFITPLVLIAVYGG